MTQATILVVDDEPDICHLLQEILEDEGFQVVTAENGAQARRHWQVERPDLVLLDIWMPDVDGVSLLNEWVVDGVAPCPVIMMSGHGTVETAVEATRLGAFDYLEKPLSMAKLLSTVERALESRRYQRIPQRVDGEASIEPIGKSPAMARLRDQVKRLAQYDTRVLFVGEPGGGKETFARYLHKHSLRREGPFIPVGVGTIAPEYSAVEFFGKEEQGKIHHGLLEQAHGGALFLDEVGDMDAETQLRLVSALESKAFLRVGGSEQVKVDMRVLTSTRRNLEEEVKAGRFRKDLFYLLNEVTLGVPPLRQHNEDVPELLNYYVDRFVTREKLDFRRFPVAVQNFLRNYAWPGNIRELKNLVHRLLILGSGEEVELEEVKTALGEIVTKESVEAPEFYDLPLKEARERFEKSYLEYHLEKHSGNVARLSQAIGMERTHLYRKLHALGIKFKDKR
ncbi:sigma-54-dependent transcriptional regulator [Methylohalobius crimeensis]|uniref:sigma-54-dependent transcriptional regulator n=1 Tax=Methylohalobius crimeensis TaxID=244365 RepID=UPI0003B463B5|nr:sigma-54 dependent transcriptional regulator [Methylohalobius crimeensis]